MRISIFAFAILISGVTNASAMTTATENYLREIGIDPKSKEVSIIDKEGTVKTTSGGDPEEFSLDSLAAQKKKNGIKLFIISRNFIRQLKNDFAGTSLEKRNWDPRFLTHDERALVGRKLVEDLK